MERIFLAIVFSTELVAETIKFNKDEILDVKWFDVDEVLNNMDDKLRNIKFVKHAVLRAKNKEITSLDILNIQ